MPASANAACSELNKYGRTFKQRRRNTPFWRGPDVHDKKQADDISTRIPRGPQLILARRPPALMAKR